MSKRGRPKLNPRFELYIWILVELLRDRRNLPRRSVVAAGKDLIKLLDVDWPIDTVRTYYKRAAAKVDDSSPEASLLAGLRKWRATENWKLDPGDLIAATDRQWRRLELDYPQQLNS